MMPHPTASGPLEIPAGSSVSDAIVAAGATTYVRTPTRRESSLLPPRRLPTIDSSTRVDVLEKNVDMLMSELGGIKALLEDLVSKGQ